MYGGMRRHEVGILSFRRRVTLRCLSWIRDADYLSKMQNDIGTIVVPSRSRKKEIIDRKL